MTDAVPSPQVPIGTATTAGARAHARSQAGIVVESMPTVPASTTRSVPDGVARDDLVWIETIPGGGYATNAVTRGTHLRLCDLEGEACTHLIVFNAHETHERLCVADTVKVLWSAYLKAGTLLLSDQGRVLCSVTGDDSGHHDTMAGPSTRARNEARYGSGSPEGTSPAGRELLLLAAAKHGLGARDLPASISLFKGVKVGQSGKLGFTGSAGAGCTVDLVAEMDLVVLLANAAHPLDPRTTYTCGPVSVSAWRSTPTHPDDPLWSSTPEAERAFLNTRRYQLARDGR